MQEKFCNICMSYYFYDDEPDSLLRVVPKAYCPKCHDPHKIPGQSYYKTVVIECFRRHLQENGVITDGLDDETLASMLQQFPIAYSVYNSNGTFLTFNIPSGTIFEGKNGRFEIGAAYLRQHAGKFNYWRDIICCRCHRTTTYATYDVLDFYLGFNPKTCVSCDPHKRNTQGLNRNGSKPSPKSERAIAKAFNMSVSDYRRHWKNHDSIKPIPALPIGHKLQCNLVVIRAYWDEDPNSYSPKYEIQCEKCKQVFVVLQKKVETVLHVC